MDCVFYHSGIKGMKWGVRRFQNPDGSLTAAGRVRYGVNDTTGKTVSVKKRTNKLDQKLVKSANKNAKKNKREKEDTTQRELQRYADLRRKPAKQLSEAEIKELSSRLQMEKTYKDLLRQTEDPKLFDGKKFVVDILQSSGKTIITGLITYGVGTAINNAANAKVINVGGKWDKPQDSKAKTK